MAKLKKTVGAKPIVDVEHPDKSAPPGNSKSVIVNNRPLLKDPMMAMPSASPDPVTNPADKSLAKAAGETKLEPLTAPILESEKPDVPKPEEPVEAVSAEPEPEIPPAEKTTAKTPGPVEPEAPQSAKDNVRQSEKEDAKKAQHEAGIEKLVNNKSYFLPINAVEKRRSRRVVAAGILLSLLLAAAWVNIALDAGLIELDGIKPLTHFFSS